MKWTLKRKRYISGKVIQGVLYDQYGDEICYTLENMERDAETGLEHCLPAGEYRFRAGMITHGSGAYNRKDDKILVGQKHTGEFVHDCLLKSDKVYYRLSRRIWMHGGGRNGRNPIVLEIES